MKIIQVIQKIMANGRSYTEKYMRAMPADGYTFKPNADFRSFAQQMLHLADANYYFISIASGIPAPIGPVSLEQTVAPEKEAVIKVVLDSYDYVTAVANTISQEQLMQTVKFGALEITKIAAFAKTYEHQAHHRGQAAVYLRLKGVIPPDGVIF